MIAAVFVVSVRTVWKWIARYQADGVAWLRDRSSRPQHSPTQVGSRLERCITRLRAQRQSGPQIANALGLPLSTVGDVLRRLVLGRLPPLPRRPPILHYERETPGELLQIDAKKLGRIAVSVIGHRITGNRAERFIQTALREWAYAKSYGSSRRHAGRLTHILQHRPAPSCARSTAPDEPSTTVNNLSGNDT